MTNHWRPDDTWRPLEPNEVALLEALTTLDFEGAAALRAQIPFTTARLGCGCGCGTIDLKVDQSRVPPGRLSEERPVPAEADVRLPGGGWDGGLILFADGGYLRCLEIYSFRDEPAQLPPVADIHSYLRPPRTTG